MQLTIQELTKSFRGTTAVNHINLTIPAGEFVAFLGPNGAGKSTTIGLLTGLTQPTSGQIKLGDLTPQMTAYREQLGVVFQDSVLDNDLTVQQNLTIRAKLYRHVDPAWQEQLVPIFGLQPLLHQKYGVLSGGQRRRVDIARALLHRPSVLLLDEPSVGLDIQTRAAIWTALTALRQTEQLTVILTTHYLEETQQADWVYVMDHGHIIASDTVQHLQQKYATYQLTLQSATPERLATALINAGIAVTPSPHGLRVAVTNAQDSIRLLNQFRSLITDFDGHPGDMNTVFLALTGREVR